ncbi:mechanosensitive ion channel protein 8-like [Dorcoceras hygrometricum]|uniref:Mechanosensitive ion channel protein n=1 Tax=Dorcoceras hygrometricum TaxID=472368 RepID=A0A2Z7BGL8_9LAMI|nr:mechanosensitive ion channel protein 8-like [Dorcoceras hygrometricum]
METFRKSFKSPQLQQEERQILLTQWENATSHPAAATMTSSSSSDSGFPLPPPTRNVGIKSNVQDSLNGDSVSGVGVNESNAHRMWRDSSYDFSNDAVMRAAAASQDFDFVAESPVAPKSPLTKIDESSGGDNNYGQLTPREVRVSFQKNTAEPPPPATRVSNAEPAEVLICSSNNSFRRRSSLLRAKTKSRLLDPPEENNQKSQTQRMVKSQVLGKGTSEFDEDDPFLDEDLPEEYKKMKCSVLSVMQLLGLILIIGALGCSLTINFFRKRTLFGLAVWKWVLMVLVLISGRLVSGWAIRIVVFFIERNFLLRKRVLYFVYGLRKPVQNCVWLTLVLIAWQCIFDNRVERVTNGKILPYVTKIWVCLLVGTLIWLLKTLIVKVLASSFHVSTFFDRIQEALFTQYVIETLSGPPLIEIQQEQEEEDRVMVEVQKLQSAGAAIPADLKANVFPKSGRIIGTPRKSTVSADARSPRISKVMSKKEQHNGITVDHLHRLNQKNISAWNMKRLMNIVRKGVISTLDERIQGSTAEDESMVQITSENQAKAAAKKIFINVARPGSKRIYQEDLMRFLREDEAVKAMRLFEGGCEQKGISKRDLKNWLVNAFRERRALALSLNDTKTAVNKLHQMMNVLVGVIIVVIWLLILKVATTHFFIFLSSQLLLVVFMFGNTCKTTFEAIIFLFVMHPFDVGDRVEVDGVQMIVEEMNILTTVFLRYDSLKIYYPNSVLSTKPINNYYRSPDMGDSIDFCIHISTPVEKIAIMKERIIRYIENKSDHWNPAPFVVMRDIEDMNRLKWSVWPSHKMNHQDMGERWARRALLVEEMVKIFRELDIEFRLLPVDVNVRHMPPLSSARLPSNWTVCTT